VSLTGRTYVEVPGYDSKIAIGFMSSFAYPVEGSGDYDHLSDILSYSSK